MHHSDRRRGPSSPATTSGRWPAWIVAPTAAILLALSTVAPAWAAWGPTRLSDVDVSPRSGTTSTTVTVRVEYRNHEGSPADWVRVLVAGASHAMSRVGDGSWKRGVAYRWSGTLPAGSHRVTVEAMGLDRSDDDITAGTVTIAASPTPTPTPRPTPTQTPTPRAVPTATPRPTPRPTPKPTPDPTPRPTPKPTPDPTPVATARSVPRATPRPTPAATAKRPSTPTEAPDPTSAGTGSAAGPASDPTAAPTDAPPSASPSDGSASPEPSDDVVAFVPAGATSAPGGGEPGSGGNAPLVPRDGSGGGGGALAALAAGVDLLTSGRPALPLGVVTTLVTTSGVVGATLAFGLFGRRRREDDPPDDVLAAAAASPLTVAATAAYVTSGPRAAGASAVAPSVTPPTAATHASVPAADEAVADGPTKAAIDAVPHPLDAELSMPRWRRPSLLEARRADPVRDAPAVPRLTFDHGLVGPIDGRERRLIRYNLVRLLDIPDELRGTELASSTRVTRSSWSRSGASTGSSCARTGGRAGSTR